MAGWPASNNQKMNSRALKDNDLLLGPLLSPSSGFDLMQNCDLPPPLKVFSGPDKTVISSMNRAFSMIGREHDHDDFDVYRGCGGENYEKLEVLKALRLSQTRARDAERKAASLIKERDCVANALFHDSFQLFAYRQWVRLLEFQVLKAEEQWQQQEKKLCCGCGRSKEVKDQLEEEEGSDDGSREYWINVALTFFLGFVGFGLAFGTNNTRLEKEVVKNQTGQLFAFCFPLHQSLSDKSGSSLSSCISHMKGMDDTPSGICYKSPQNMPHGQMGHQLSVNQQLDKLKGSQEMGKTGRLTLFEAENDSKEETLKSSSDLSLEKRDLKSVSNMGALQLPRAQLIGKLSSLSMLIQVAPSSTPDKTMSAAFKPASVLHLRQTNGAGIFTIKPMS
ncbi:hypothetical protein D5086_015241 [Populus alba]|uniref:Uncharacterized protein n=1 Tax=Populus alba TaxID=43335 RepID=A0ACC4BZY4_POPAL